MGLHSGAQLQALKDRFLWIFRKFPQYAAVSCHSSAKNNGTYATHRHLTGSKALFVSDYFLLLSSVFILQAQQISVHWISLLIYQRRFLGSRSDISLKLACSASEQLFAHLSEETNRRTNGETNGETTRETNRETNWETIRETKRETKPEPGSQPNWQTGQMTVALLTKAYSSKHCVILTPCNTRPFIVMNLPLTSQFVTLAVHFLCLHLLLME